MARFFVAMNQSKICGAQHLQSCSSSSRAKMAVTVVSFRWLEILEKEFDKNFVDLDLLIGE